MSEKFKPFARRTFLKSLLAVAAASSALFSYGGSEAGSVPASQARQLAAGINVSAPWYASWYGSPQNYNETVFTAPPVSHIENKTLRQIMYVSAGGNSVRLKISNRFGTEALRLDSANIADSAGNGAIVPATLTPVTFNSGQTSLTVAPGEETWSDPVRFRVNELSSIAISLYIKDKTARATEHTLGRQDNYMASGDQTSNTTLTGASTYQYYAFTTALDVAQTGRAKVIVTFGDSITDGYNSTASANNRYPNYLARRLADIPSLGHVSVVNAGISGNRWKHDVIGPKGEGRFERDVLDRSGITHAIVLLGINDLGFPFFFPTQNVTATDITNAMQIAVDKAKARGVKIYLATLLPYKGAVYFTADGEAKRQQINAWIRANRTIDGVVDFDLVMRNPTDPLTMNPAYDSGDHLHPNDAGYQAMANAVDVDLL
jgi:lysophospholipase L1-like esterase